MATDAREGDAYGISKSSIAAYKLTTRKRSMRSWRALEYIDKDGEVVALCTDCAGVVDKCHDSDFISEVQSLLRNKRLINPQASAHTAHI